MLGLAVVFFLLASVSAALGFAGIAGSAVESAKVLLAIFLALFVISLLGGMFRRR